MKEVPPSEELWLPQLHLSDIQDLTAQSARYELMPAPQDILVRGFTAASIECGAEITTSAPGAASEGLAGKIGGMCWYVAEMARIEGIDLDELGERPGMTLDEFQACAVEEPAIMPICTEKGIPVVLSPEDTLNVLTLRVVDAGNPTEDWLWYGYEPSDSPDDNDIIDVLEDLLAFLAVIASKHGLALSDVLEQTIDRQLTRKDEPRVIAEELVFADAALVMTDAGLDRSWQIRQALQHLTMLDRL